MNNFETKSSIPPLEELLSSLDDILVKSQNKLDKSSKKSRDSLVVQIKKHYPEIKFQLSNFKKILKPTEKTNLNTFQENFKENVFEIILDKKDLEAFVSRFVFNNKNLNAEEKTFMIKLINSEEGPWSSKGSVKDVFSDDDRITVKTRNGESYYYPNH